MKINPFLSGALFIAIAVIVLLRVLPPVAPLSDTHARLAAPPLRVSARTFRRATPSVPAVGPGTNDLPATNLIGRLLRGDVPKLTADQIELFLRQNHRNAESLLAAFRATDDRAYLREAMEKFPNDPRVDLMAFYRMPRTEGLNDPASAERRKWLDTFRQSDPDNALPGLLSARDDFKAGRRELALQEFITASEKPNLRDYLRDSIQNTEEAYRLAGYSEVEAKAFAMDGLRLAHWSEVQRLGGNLVELGRSYRKANDETSAQTAFQMVAQLAARLDQPQSLTIASTFGGIIIQRDILQLTDPNSPYGSAGQTVQNQIDALNQRYAALGDRVRQVRQILPTVPDADLLNYFQRTELFGEEAAERWLVDRYAPQ